MYKFRAIKLCAVVVALTLFLSNSFAFAEDSLRVVAADERLSIDPRPTQNMLLHRNWVRYFMTLNRRFCRRDDVSQKKVMFYPASAASVVEFLITDADVAILADNHFRGDVSEMSNYLKMDMTKGSPYQSVYYNRGQIRTMMIREEYDEELLKQFIIGLRCIGAENIRIECPEEEPRLTKIKWDWAYWGEEQRERIIYLVHSKTEPDVPYQGKDFDATKLEQYPEEVQQIMGQGVDYVIFKACGDLTHSEESGEIRRYVINVLNPNGKIFTERDPWQNIGIGLDVLSQGFVLYSKQDDGELLDCEQKIRDMLEGLKPYVVKETVAGVWGYSKGGVKVWTKRDSLVDTPALAYEIERARELPGRLKACVEQFEALKASGLSSRAIVAGQDELTKAIKAAVPVPPPQPYEQGSQQTLPTVKIDEPRGILVVGADGYIGREHLQVVGQLCKANKDLKFLGGLDIRPISDETKELFRKNNPEQELPEFTTAEEAISDAKNKYGLDPSQIIVIIATPDEEHFKNIKEFANLNVIEFIVEKPIAGTAEEMTDIKNFAVALPVSLKIAGAGQVFGSAVVEKIKEIMGEKNFQTVLYLLSWSKDRRERSREGENMGPLKERTNILAHFDLFHQLGILEMLDGNRVAGVDYAYSRDMVLLPDALPDEDEGKGKIFRNHGLGVVLINLKKGEKESGAKAICYSSFIEPGGTRPNEKAIVLVGADGSVIIADVAATDGEAETVIYVPSQGKMEIYLVQENRSSMLARMDMQLINALAGGKELPASSPASLDFQARMVELMREAGKLAEAGPKPYSTVSAMTKSGIELTNI